MKKNIFGQYLIIKKLLIALIGALTYKTFSTKRFNIQGTSILNEISNNNVLFISNHHTYFYDFIAALETMKTSLITKILSYTGSILIKRTWREAGKEINRNIRVEDFDNIKKALNDGWVITFPRGTTDNSKPVRPGTAHIIKSTNPIVIPITINGFDEVFEKNSLKIKNRNKSFSLKFGNPLKFDYNESIESITSQIEKIIN